MVVHYSQEMEVLSFGGQKILKFLKNSIKSDGCMFFGKALILISTKNIHQSNHYLLIAFDIIF